MVIQHKYWLLQSKDQYKCYEAGKRNNTLFHCYVFIELSVHPLFHLCHNRVGNVIVVIHYLVDDTVRCKFNYTIGKPSV